ncbi:MAG: MFS transporter [Rubrivivax sp.]|nr:MFS transporter [Rubrivivax sp.]
MRRFLAEYAEFFRQPEVARFAAAGFVARMPIGMVGFAMLMMLREALGSYALAGWVCGTYFVMIAVSAPAQGRWIDRRGARGMFFFTWAVHVAALVAVGWLAQIGATWLALTAAAAVAGAFIVPMSTLTRLLWRHRFVDDEATLRRAFAVDATLIEMNYALGPVVVAAVLAAAGARVAFAVAVGAAALAPGAFALSRALRLFRPGPLAERHWLGPLTQPRLRWLLAATFGIGMGFGFIEIGYPGLASALGTPALAGVWLTLCSLGSGVTGAVFGGLALRAPIERQFFVATGAMVVPLALHAGAQGPLAFALVAFLAGGAIAPSLACQSVLVARLAPAQYAAEAFTWSSTSLLTGVGAGMAAGGWLVEMKGPRAPFVIGALVMAVVAATAWSLAHPREPAR